MHSPLKSQIHDISDYLSKYAIYISNNETYSRQMKWIITTTPFIF